MVSEESIRVALDGWMALPKRTSDSGTNAGRSSGSHPTELLTLPSRSSTNWNNSSSDGTRLPVLSLVSEANSHLTLLLATIFLAGDQLRHRHAPFICPTFRNGVVNVVGSVHSVGVGQAENDHRLGH